MRDCTHLVSSSKKDGPRTLIDTFSFYIFFLSILQACLQQSSVEVAQRQKDFVQTAPWDFTFHNPRWLEKKAIAKWKCLRKCVLTCLLPPLRSSIVVGKDLAHERNRSRLLSKVTGAAEAPLRSGGLVIKKPDIAYYPVIWAKRRNVIHQAIDYHREFFEIGMLLMLYTSYVSIDWVMIGHVTRLHQGHQTGQSKSDSDEEIAEPPSIYTITHLYIPSRGNNHQGIVKRSIQTCGTANTEVLNGFRDNATCTVQSACGTCTSIRVHIKVSYEQLHYGIIFRENSGKSMIFHPVHGK
ncbi:hypothetical protein CEXT_9651 [Caerostris extrusa]|uniref:Uncharacterized protein n=1 Tax=Caerostris extrusa TaxID=172846 RepID=A0AAV4TGX6_CAEEX|nr:hypothetical protein CEXT_9651 [Caerostris extrusa]